jgi:hypothetical protein
MPMIVPNNIGPPNFLTVLVRSPAFAIDLTTVTAANFLVRRQDASIATWAPIIVSATQSELLLQYPLASGDITVTGPYGAGVQLVTVNGNVPASSFQILVTTPYDNSPYLYAESWAVTSTLLSSASVKQTWTQKTALLGGSTFNLSPFQPLVRFDPTLGNITLNLWAALDGDDFVANDYLNKLGAFTLTAVGNALQKVPTGGSPAFASTVSSNTAGTILRWKFDAALQSWVSR